VRAVLEQHVYSKDDARQAPRHYYCVPITIDMPEGSPGGPRRMRAATNNISKGGFAFIADTLIRAGTTINVYFDSLPGTPRAIGIVRSSAYLCGTQHRVGVEFVRPAPRRPKA